MTSMFEMPDYEFETLRVASVAARIAASPSSGPQRNEKILIEIDELELQRRATEPSLFGRQASEPLCGRSVSYQLT